MPTYIITKNGTRERPRNVLKEQFNTAPYGTEFSYTPFDNPLVKYHFSGSLTYGGANYNKLKSLKNTINYYSGIDDIYNFQNFINTPIAFLCFNSYHLGSGINRSSVELSFYQSGSLIDRATDSRENGVLYNKNDEKVGIVLYREGFILLNHTGAISDTSSYFVTPTNYDAPRWSYYMASASSDVYCTNNYTVVNEVPVETIFCYADKNNLNHSNNPTYISYIKSATAPIQIGYNLNFSNNQNIFYISLF